MSRIKGIEILDEMFPSSPDPDDLEKKELLADPGPAGKNPKKKDGPPAAKKQVTKGEDKGEPPASGRPMRLKRAIKQKEKEPGEKENLEPAAEDEFFTVVVKPTFKDTHRQDNVWLENPLHEELFKIFENRPKGFKTEFYNRALWFAVKRYKEVNNR